MSENGVERMISFSVQLDNNASRGVMGVTGDLVADFDKGEFELIASIVEVFREVTDEKRKLIAELFTPTTFLDQEIGLDFNSSLQVDLPPIPGH